MNKNSSDFLFIQRWIIFIAGFAAIVFGGFYFFKASAQTESLEKPAAEQVLVNGKLAFTRRFAGPTAPDGRVIISNPDGSGQATLGTPSNEDMVQPAWSPDGTKLVFASVQPNADLYVINASGGGVLNITNTGSATSERNPSWSATGKIAYERGGQIWVINPDGTGNAQFSGITQPSQSAPAWSPDGTKLAFVSNNQIWVINADGTNEHRVTPNGGVDPAWSPDGTKLVFTKSGISVINADGTGEIVIAGSGNSPSWSPDGTKIAFRGGSAGGGVYTMDANGANQVRIVADVINFPLCCDIIYENPAWQPVAQTPNTYIISGRVTYNNLSVSGVTVTLSGTTNASTTTDAIGNYQFSALSPGGNYTVTPSRQNYLFTPANRSFNNLSSNQTGNFEVAGICITAGRCVKNGKIAFTRSGDIFTMNADGSNQTNITNNAATDSEPNYSPFGSSIIFSTNRDGNYEIYRMNADGTNPVNLTNNAASDTSPRYSPDGTSIVFVSNRDGNYEIYKMNADGSNQVRLTNNTNSDYSPVFSPDGNKILYVAFSGSQQTPTKLYTMNADGSNPQQFPAPSGIVPAYEWLSYSPDGSKIIFTYTPDASTQIRVNWTMNADGTNAARFPADGSYGSYSPDGTQVVYTCCIFNNTNRVNTANADGSSVRIITPNNTGNGLPAWQPLPLTRRTPFDYDGDSRADVSVFRPSENKWYILQSSTTSVRDTVFAVAGDVPAPADYDGDGKTDLAIFRPSVGDWWYLSSINNAQINVHWGQSGDIPRPSDFDGDGKTDYVVYRPSNSTWYRLGSTGATSIVTFGTSEDKPLIGDFDGDGKSDPAIFRPSTGDWWYAASAEGGQHRAVHWGANGDYPVPGDYDGDGKTDFVVFRPTDGGWYILYTTGSYTIATFGTIGDKPIAADYDGDGKADIAVFRPSTGTWFLLQTTAGFGAVQWGTVNDIPTENAFIP